MSTCIRSCLILELEMSCNNVESEETKDAIR